LNFSGLISAKKWQTRVVRYVKTAFPALVPYISHNLSPMGTIAKYIK
jgi:hypothetical protein